MTAWRESDAARSANHFETGWAEERVTNNFTRNGDGGVVDEICCHRPRCVDDPKGRQRCHGGQGKEQVDAVLQLRGYGTNQAQIRRRDSALEFPANPGQQVQLRAPAV